MSLTRRTALGATGLLAALGLAACSGSAGPGAGPSASPSTPSTPSAGSSQELSGELTVLAAASLQAGFERIGKRIEQEHPGLTITFDFQGSQDLVASLADGASADVLATASTSTMDKAVSQSLVGEPQDFATNALTLIVPKGNPARVTGLDSSLTGADLVVCAPEVPCGEATGRLATALGITLDPVSEEQKVTDVRGKVESGEAQAGIVYATDAAAATGVEEISIPDGGVVNHYPIAATAEPANPQAAQLFIDTVLGRTGQTILADAGFGAPEGAPRSAGATPTAPGSPRSTGSPAATAEPSGASPEPGPQETAE
ncbi:molybdate ABC transporter substrate-binding protein [Actinomyces bowdenii]|uniref:Molybdate ABC transporter substrate-binding protein n=1 Tax=Actinomyces bowdenii TaxID=131109 RepID=A0A3P1V862_9ACTO|nr:molybdate ABC transporter substrate-binding protein [Actinomyces bowdenii]RRD30321.1 molybdate ABC transporter substrate-binding protein [Actinomyces bowdenii]